MTLTVYQTGVDAGFNRHIIPGALLKVIAYSANRVMDFSGGLHGPDRIVVVGCRCAEYGHHFIAKKSFNSP